MLVNYLYNFPTKKRQELDINQLEMIGGIGIIVQLYKDATVLEEQENLFLVIFDYLDYSVLPFITKA